MWLSSLSCYLSVFPPANRQLLQMLKIPLFSYIRDVSLGCVFGFNFFAIIREFLQTSHVMFLAALVAQRGLSPDVNTQESSPRAFVFGHKDTPERSLSNLGLRYISCQKLHFRETHIHCFHFSLCRTQEHLFVVLVMCI